VTKSKETESQKLRRVSSDALTRIRAREKEVLRKGELTRNSPAQGIKNISVRIFTKEKRGPERGKLEDELRKSSKTQSKGFGLRGEGYGEDSWEWLFRLKINRR